MSTPFEPADGVEARWKKVYHRLKGMKPGDVLTYASLDELFPGMERGSLQSVIRRAAKEFLEKDSRGLRNLRGEGYRVVDPEEHVQIARVHQTRSMRSLKRGHEVVTNVDFNGMPKDIRELTEATARALSMQMAFNQRMDIRHRRLAETVAQTVDRTEANEQQIEDLKARLARLEGGKE